MKKKILCAALALSALLSLAACGDNDSSKAEVNSKAGDSIAETDSEEAPAESAADPAAVLEDANKKAKLTYTSVYCGSADMMADGESDKIKTGTFGPIAVSLLDETNHIEAEIKKNFTENGFTEGYVLWELDESKQPTYAQWAQSITSSVIGQYPDPVTDPAAENNLGKKF